MISYRKFAAAAAVAACAVMVPAVGSAHAATMDEGDSGQSVPVDRNLIKPPPGGVLAPVADAVSTGKELLSPK